MTGKHNLYWAVMMNDINMLVIIDFDSVLPSRDPGEAAIYTIPTSAVSYIATAAKRHPKHPRAAIIGTNSPPTLNLLVDDRINFSLKPKNGNKSTAITFAEFEDNTMVKTRHFNHLTFSLICTDTSHSRTHMAMSVAFTDRWHHRQCIGYWDLHVMISRRHRSLAPIPLCLR